MLLVILRNDCLRPRIQARYRNGNSVGSSRTITSIVRLGSRWYNHFISVRITNGVLIMSRKRNTRIYGQAVNAVVSLESYGTSGDADALAYIAAVEAADGEPLEAAVRSAINTFVTGLKTDDIWDDISDSCILAGARTLAGALVPLAGTAPTNFNFVAGDYNRKTGLVGNGSNKRLATAFTPPVTASVHLAVYMTVKNDSSSGNRFISSDSSRLTVLDGATGARCRVGSSTLYTLGSTQVVPNLVGVSRAGNEFDFLFYAVGGTQADTFISYPTDDVQIFCGISNGTPASFSASRISFYSAGVDTDLSKLSGRVATLMTTLGTIIV